MNRLASDKRAVVEPVMVTKRAVLALSGQIARFDGPLAPMAWGAGAPSHPRCPAGRMGTGGTLDSMGGVRRMIDRCESGVFTQDLPVV